MAPALLPSCTEAARWLRSRCRGELRVDSRLVRPGDAFVAWPGQAHDGRRFVGAALAAGAVACLVEAEGAAAFALDDARVAALPALKHASGALADEFYGRPSERIDLIAVTGTNGKTSTAWWTAQALSALGRRCGVVGTLGVGQPPAVESTGLTTPDPFTLHSAFRRFADAGFAACAIEASSIGIAEERLAGTRVAVAQFTNFTRDHLDFHGTMDAYWTAKRRLFDSPGLRAAVVHVGDAQGAALARELGGRAGLDLWPVSARGDARLAARDVGYRDGALAFTIAEGAASAPVRSALVGDYNVENLLVVLGALRALDVPLAEAAGAVAALTPVPGRLQRITVAADAEGQREAGPEVIVDYAHTPDALDKTLRALKPLAAARGGVLWCVFGCGGNRDATKRPLMGAIAAREAAHVVVTSDNPRHEAPEAIVAQIVAGIDGGVTEIVDRRAAIAHALRAAADADVVLIAGKGHEDYQEIAGVRHPFSDAAVAAQLLARRRR
jgi:UDP-N-acetylmuramoyl-L-alanyl-D-glutamate--2,6-diaminopimelate ligase